MDITGEYRIAASRETVWSALNDPEILRHAIPGCEHLEQVSETEMAARILAKIGPVRSKFDTRLEIKNLNPPAGYTLVGEGKGGAAGFGRGSADVSLEEDGEITILRYQADFKVGGKLAQVGSRLVLAATRKTADEFFSAFSTQLDPSAEKVTTEEERPVSAARSRLLRRAAIIGATVLVLIALYIWFS